jgi:hypothetical protein
LPNPRAVAWLQRGFERQKTGDYAGAAEAYRASVEADPGFHPGWANLGVACRRLGRIDEAIACYRRALTADPDNPSLLGNLGNALRDACRHGEAAAVLRRALALRPDAARTWRNLAVTLDEADDVAGALEAYDRAAALAPEDPETVWLRCLARLSLGDFSVATWQAFEARWSLPGLVPLHGLSSAPRWRGEPRAGRKLLIVGEQGFGDTLLASRYLACVSPADGPLAFLCQPELRRLLEPCVRGLGYEVCDSSTPAPDHDLVAPVMSLIGLFTRSPGELPSPLPIASPGAGTVPDTIQPANGQLKVGIVWSGNVGFAGNSRRAVTLARFLRFLDIEGIRLFSLQVGAPRSELQAEPRAAAIVDLTGGIRDFADTAHLLSRLDLLVTTDTAIAHLAGTLQTPVWNLIHAGGYSFYLRGRLDCPWYPSMRLFRQPQPGDWDAVFDAVAVALREAATAHRSRLQ